MGNPYFRFKQFAVYHDTCAMKVNTDGCLLGGWANHTEPKNILDIGAGSGVIGLMLAQRFEHAQITLVEIDAQCATQCALNAAKSPFAERVSTVNSAIQDFKPNTQFDLIVSNPPYFENDTPAVGEARLSARHHHTLTLKELFHAAACLLTTNGQFCLILPYHRLAKTLEIASQVGLQISQQINIRSLPNKPVTRVLLAFSTQPSALKIKEMNIEVLPGEYSAESKQLLGDFYLNL